MFYFYSGILKIITIFLISQEGNFSDLNDREEHYKQQMDV